MRRRLFSDLSLTQTLVLTSPVRVGSGWIRPISAFAFASSVHGLNAPSVGMSLVKRRIEERKKVFLALNGKFDSSKTKMSLNRKVWVTLLKWIELKKYVYLVAFPSTILRLQILR